MTSIADANAQIAKAVLNMGRFDRIVNGDKDTTVAIDSGTVRSLRGIEYYGNPGTGLNNRYAWTSGTMYRSNATATDFVIDNDSSGASTVYLVRNSGSFVSAVAPRNDPSNWATLAPNYLTKANIATALGASGADAVQFTGLFANATPTDITARLSLAPSLTDWCVAGSSTPMLRKVELQNDAGPAIRRCLADLAAQGIDGIDIRLPPWRCKIATATTISVNGVRWVGHGRYASSGGALRSSFYRTDIGFTPFTFASGCSGGGFDSVVWEEDHGDYNANPFTPKLYPPWIVCANGSRGQMFANQFLYGVYKWVKLGSSEDGSGSTGQQQFRDIMGHVLGIGIDQAYCADVVKVDGVHLWPFCGSQAGLTAWCQANAVGMRSARNDDPIWSNLFMGGLYKGISVENAADGTTTTGIQGTNITSDFTRFGLAVTASGSTRNRFANLRIQPGPNPGLADSRGIYFPAGANNNEYGFSGLIVARTNRENIAVLGTGNIISIPEGLLEHWDDQGTGSYYAVNAASGNIIKVDSDMLTFVHDNARYYTGGATFKGVKDSGRDVSVVCDSSGRFTLPVALGGLPPKVVFFGSQISAPVTFNFLSAGANYAIFECWYGGNLAGNGTALTGYYSAAA